MPPPSTAIFDISLFQLLTRRRVLLRCQLFRNIIRHATKSGDQCSLAVPVRLTYCAVLVRSSRETLMDETETEPLTRAPPSTRMPYSIQHRDKENNMPCTIGPSARWSRKGGSELLCEQAKTILARPPCSLACVSTKSLAISTASTR